MRRAVAAGAAALALALGATACGGDDEGAEGPAAASVAPAYAVFGNVVVRPEGDQAEAASSALSKLLDNDDPGGVIVEQIDNGLRAEDAGITYAEDIEPWLGENLGMFLINFLGAPDGAFVAEVTDQAAAEAMIDNVRAADASRARSESYEGVEYEVDDDDTATGFVDDLLVVGTEEGFRAAVDASIGESLADSDAFSSELETVPENTLAMLFADVPAFVDRQVEIGELSPGQVDRQLGAFGESPALAALSASEDAVTAQTTTGAGEGSDPEQSPLLEQLPGEAWLAFGATDLGDAVDGFLERLEVPGFPGSTQLDIAIRSALGSRLVDLTGWIGDAAGYVSGTSILGIGAALELETTDESASEASIDDLLRLVRGSRDFQIAPLSSGETGFGVTPRGLPAQIVVTQREGRVIVGLGDRSVDDVLQPDETLADSDAFGSATDALGSDYSAGLFLQFEPMLELLEGTGATEGDPEYEAARPYLDHLDYLVAGRAREDDRYLTRVVLGLR